VKFIDFGFTNLDCEELYVGDGNIWEISDKE
jgi:hypothetical protein